MWARSGAARLGVCMRSRACGGGDGHPRWPGQAGVAGGLADAEAGVKCTPQTRFQLCSVSKQFAAAAAMLLVQSGQLDLAEPVARWLPGCPPQWQRVTLHHLLTHTAGVRHWGNAPGFDA